MISETIRNWFQIIFMASCLIFKDITFSIDVVYCRDNPALVIDDTVKEDN